MYLPGRPVDDKVLILEDTDGDGKADKQTVFADKLHVPTGIELGDGGAYVAQQPNLMFLKDLDGDDKADVSDLDHARLRHGRLAPRDARLHLGPGWGTLLARRDRSTGPQVETPYGPQTGRRRRHLPVRAEDVQVRYLRLVRLLQSLGPLLRPLGAERGRRRLGRGQLLRHRLLRPGRLSEQAWPAQGDADQAVAADFGLRAGLEPELPRRDPGGLPAQ